MTARGDFAVRSLGTLAIVASCGCGRTPPPVASTGSATERAAPPTPTVCVVLFDGIRVPISVDWNVELYTPGLQSFKQSVEGSTVAISLRSSSRCERAKSQAPALDPAFPPAYFIDGRLNATRTTDGVVVSDIGCFEGPRRALMATVFEYPPSARPAIRQLLTTFLEGTGDTSSAACR